MKVVVCGSRYKGANVDTILHVMGVVKSRVAALPQDTLVITGGALGVDRWAHREAGHHRGLQRKVIPALWMEEGVYNPRAGFERNGLMLDEKPDLVIAVWDGESSGTKDTIDQARSRNIRLEVIDPFECAW